MFVDFIKDQIEIIFDVVEDYVIFVDDDFVDKCGEIFDIFEFKFF